MLQPTSFSRPAPIILSCILRSREGEIVTECCATYFRLPPDIYVQGVRHLARNVRSPIIFVHFYTSAGPRLRSRWSKSSHIWRREDWFNFMLFKFFTWKRTFGKHVHLEHVTIRVYVRESRNFFVNACITTLWFMDYSLEALKCPRKGRQVGMKQGTRGVSLGKWENKSTNLNENSWDSSEVHYKM